MATYTLNPDGYLRVYEEDTPGIFVGLWGKVVKAEGGFSESDIGEYFEVFENQVINWINQGILTEVRLNRSTNFPALKEVCIQATTIIDIPDDSIGINPPPDAIQNYGVITGLTSSFVSGELIVNVNITNNSQYGQEYRVYLYDFEGNKLDKEPDLFWKNVQSGQSHTFTVDTNLKATNLEDVMRTGGYRVVLKIQGGIYADSRLVTNEGNIYPEDITPGEYENPDNPPQVVDPEPTTTTPGNDDGWNIGDWFGDDGNWFGDNASVLAVGAILLIAILMNK